MGMPEQGSSRELDAVFDQSPVALVFADPELRARRTNAAFRRLFGLPDEAVIGRRPSEVDEHMDMALIERTITEQVVRKGVPVADVPVVETQGGKRRVILWSADPVTENGQVLGVLCRFRDVTGQTTSLEQAHVLLERAVHEIGTTLDICRTAEELADLAVPELADRVVVDLLDQVLQGENLPRTDSGTLQLRRVAVRDSSETRAKISFKAGDLFAAPLTSEAALALLRGSPLLSRNPAEIRRKAPYAPGHVEALLAQGMHTTMAVPLIARGVTLGAAAFWRAENPEPYGEADVRLASGIASRAAVSIDNARLYTREHATAITYQELASVDGITGVYNRRHFMEAAEATLARAQRLGQSLVALMIDVDSFKKINDTHGHAVGDQVLAEIAQACREAVRSSDIVGRYGGDEFSIIVAGITSLHAAQIADQLARSAARVLGHGGKPLTYSASVGIAECLPGWDLPTLLTHADQAMYEAKRAGGASWRVCDDTTQATQPATRQITEPAPASGRPPPTTGRAVVSSHRAT
jgi:diguanylate cyclase (GGDEF)-like protein/PAS domain S-box-containing protein